MEMSPQYKRVRLRISRCDAQVCSKKDESGVSPSTKRTKLYFAAKNQFSLLKGSVVYDKNMNLRTRQAWV